MKSVCVCVCGGGRGGGERNFLRQKWSYSSLLCFGKESTGFWLHFNRFYLVFNQQPYHAGNKMSKTLDRVFYVLSYSYPPFFASNLRKKYKLEIPSFFILQTQLLPKHPQYTILEGYKTCSPLFPSFAIEKFEVLLSRTKYSRFYGSI